MHPKKTQTELVTPSQRLQSVPVTCSKHSDHFGWCGFRVEDYRDLPESDFASPAMDHHLLVYHYKALEGDFTHDCAGHRTTTRLQTRQLSFIPAGADNHWTFGCGGPSALHILVHAECFDEMTSSSGMELRDDFQVTSSQLQNIAARLRIELKCDGSSGVLFAETMMEMVCSAMVAQFSAAKPSLNCQSCKVALARDLIESEYARTIHLSELAHLCDLSQSQLLRAFKAEYGTSPHQYLLARRVNEAKDRLLAYHREPLAQMSVDLGFADQSHFTRQFTRSTGVTPHHFRSHK